MKNSIFYSWQSDLPNRTNRSFIQYALEQAAKSIANDDLLGIEPVIDRDTQNTAGSPDIAQTIFAKIDDCAVFVADVSIITPEDAPRPCPNPNVLLELGYAIRTLGWGRIILVHNRAFGRTEQLPFDLRPRRAIPYSCSSDDDVPERRAELSSRLRRAIAECFASRSDRDQEERTEFLSAVLSELIMALIYLDERERRTLNPGFDVMRDVLTAMGDELRHLATHAHAQPLGFGEDLEALARKTTVIAQESLYLGGNPRLDSLLTECRDECQSLKDRILDDSEYSMTFRDDLLAHLAACRRELEATARQGEHLLTLPVFDAERYSDEVTEIGERLLKLGYYGLERVLGNESASQVHDAARKLHLLSADDRLRYEHDPKRLVGDVQSAAREIFAAIADPASA